MDFKIPLTYSSLDVLRKKSKKFSKIFRNVKESKLKDHLENCDVDIEVNEYLGICLKTTVIAFAALFVFFSLIFFLFRLDLFILFGLITAFLFSIFVWFSQYNYPKLFSVKKTKDIEKNLIPALQDMLVQLESGVPMFQIIVNISSSDYGEVSLEFKKAVKAINSGQSHIDALKDLIKSNESIYLKRVLWQISNGLRSGSDMAIVIKDSVENLNKEQEIQIQSYGSRLNPLIMFYMLTAVILPSLGITFLTIISSMLGLSSDVIQMLFIAILIFVVLFQIMFMGLIRSRRPSLL